MGDIDQAVMHMQVISENAQSCINTASSIQQTIDRELYAGTVEIARQISEFRGHADQAGLTGALAQMIETCVEPLDQLQVNLTAARMNAEREVARMAELANTALLIASELVRGQFGN